MIQTKDLSFLARAARTLTGATTMARAAAMLLAVMMMTTLGVQTARAQEANSVTVNCCYWDNGYNGWGWHVGTTGGTASASPNRAIEGYPVTLTATPAAGYRFFDWEVVMGGVPLADAYSATTTFTMPNNEVRFFALFFSDAFKIVRTSATPSAGGTVRVSKDNATWTSAVIAQPGEKVYFALTPNSGYQLSGYGIDAGETPVTTVGNSFTMPDGDVTVSATFTENSYGIAPAPGTITVIRYLENIGDASCGTASASASSASAGITVTVTAMPAAGYTFKEWASNISGMTFADKTSATTTFVMPNENVAVTACFKQESAATLSESDGLTSAVFAATNGKYATFGRTFTSGVASTVCLPFNYASSQASGKFYVFAGIDKTKDPWEVTMVNANKVSGMLTAGTPYLFMPSADQTATFGGTVKASTAGYTDQTDGDGGTWRFIGNYEEKRWDATHNTEEIGSIYGFASGQGYEGTAASTAAGEFIRLRTGGIKPFRAYMKYTAPAGARTRGEAAELPEKMTVRLVDEVETANGAATGIVTPPLTPPLEGAGNGCAWYSLDGRRLAGEPTQKGVYVNGGRKVVIK